MSNETVQAGGQGALLVDAPQTMLQQFMDARWMGIRTPWFFLIFISLAASCYLGKTPPGFLGGFALATVFGGFLDKIGENTPIVKDYLGGGSMVALFGGAFLIYFHVIPAGAAKQLSAFVKEMDYLGLVVSALIGGSILGMDRSLLIKAGLRYAVPILGGLACACLLTFIAGSIMGYGGTAAVMMVCMPIMGGGTAAGAVPLSQIYGAAVGISPTEFLSRVMPAVAMGNALAVIGAGMLNKMGEKIPSISGKGELMVGFEAEKYDDGAPDYLVMGQGFILTGLFFAFGRMLSLVIPLHYYALTILTVAFIKILNLFPKELERGMRQWYAFVAKIGIPAVLFTIGSVYTDMNLVLDALTVEYGVLCILTLAGAILGAGLCGRLVKFYFVESAVTAGLCMANMGGSGDVATLASAKRMNLMPFAQISSRLGGAMILIICSLLVQLVGLG